MSIDENDQIFKIFNKTFINVEHDFSHLTDEPQIQYAEGTYQQANEEKKLIRDQFKKSAPELIELLEQMLEFNPYFRPTARQLLKNKIFDSIRIPSIEERSPQKIVIDIDKNEFR